MHTYIYLLDPICVALSPSVSNKKLAGCLANGQRERICCFLICFIVKTDPGFNHDFLLKSHVIQKRHTIFSSAS